MSYLFHILVVFEIYLILALSMNLLAGHSGLLSLAQAAFCGIGAYCSAILLIQLQLPFLAVLLLSVLITGVASLPMIWFSVRLRDLYFILATLAYQIIIFSILFNWVSVTNGPLGIAGIPKPEILGIRFGSTGEFLLLSTLITAFVVAFFFVLYKTPLSRLFEAVRDNELALVSFGKNPSYYKASAILIACGVSGIAGVLFATYYSYIDPMSFDIHESILILSIVLIGGLGTVKGSVAGALFYVLLPELLRFLNMPDAIAANMRMMIFSLVLILIVMYKPYGLFGKFKFE